VGEWVSEWVGGRWIPGFHSHSSLTLTHCHSLSLTHSATQSVSPTDSPHARRPRSSQCPPPTHPLTVAGCYTLSALSLCHRPSVSQSVSQSVEGRDERSATRRQRDNTTPHDDIHDDNHDHPSSSPLLPSFLLCSAVLCCVLLCCGMLDCVESFTHSLGVVWCCRMCCCFRFRIPFVQSERHCYRHGRKGAAWLRVGGVSVVLD